jgi:hypothetical protein
MIAGSSTFRAQCRRLADAPALYVRLRVVDSLTPSTLRAVSVIQRTQSGPLLASVDILEGVDAVEWIAHELEHVIEQVEGVRIRNICAEEPRLCEAVPGAIDTMRAVLAGRVVLTEVERSSREPHSRVRDLKPAPDLKVGPTRGTAFAVTRTRGLR